MPSKSPLLSQKIRSELRDGVADVSRKRLGMGINIFPYLIMIAPFPGCVLPWQARRPRHEAKRLRDYTFWVQQYVSVINDRLTVGPESAVAE